MASNVTAKIFEKGAPVMEQGGDMDSSRNAAEVMLKMTEIFYYHNPDSEIYLTLLAKSYGNYAYGFLENDILRYKDVDKERYSKAVTQAKYYYTKGKDYGLKVLEEKSGKFKEALTLDMDAFEKSLQKFGKKDVPILYWTAFAWANYINLSRDEPKAVTELGRVELMMRRVLELNEEFFYGSPHLFYAVYYASRPPMLGGNPDKSKQHFSQAMYMTQNHFLLSLVNYAQFYAVRIQDRALFTEYLQRVLNTDPNILPEQQLANLIAQDRARILLAHTSEYF